MQKFIATETVFEKGIDLFARSVVVVSLLAWGSVLGFVSGQAVSAADASRTDVPVEQARTAKPVVKAAAKAKDVDKVKVVIKGISGDIQQNALRFLTLERRKESSDLTARKLQQWFEKGEDEIKAALQPYGYYQPKITARLTHDSGKWVAEYQVAAGPVTTVSAVDIRVVGPGKDLPALVKALEQFKPKRTQVLIHEQYKNSKDALFQALLEAGYLDVAFEKARIAIRPKKQQAQIEITLNTGHQYFFGPTRIKQSILNESFFSKYKIIPEGEPFNTQTIINQKLLLDDSRYFATIEPFPLKSEAVDYHIPIEIETTPRQPRRYTVGVGYGTDTGPRVNGGVEFRRVNRMGHKVDTTALFSPVIQNANFRYRIPFKDVRTDEIALGSRAEVENIDNNKSQRVVFAIERLENWWSLRRKLYVETTLEDFETSTRNSFARIITPGVQLIHQELDNALFTRRGVRVELDTRFASTDFHSTVNFQRISLNAGAIYPVGGRSRLILRGEAGWLETDSFADVPPVQRFYAGGARNVRGYGYRQLGASDAEGSPVGGGRYVFGSIEMDALFWGNFGLAMFYDTGASYDTGNLSEMNTITGTDDRLKPAAGLGFRWKSPVGMLRLDLASPLKETEDQFQIHFSIGPDL